MAADPEAAAAAVRSGLRRPGRRAGRRRSRPSPTGSPGAEALRHIFAVAASLDSQVIGEPQVLGQVKEAHRLAQAAGLVGGSLEEALQAAYAAAKRVRSETGLAEQPVSIAAVVVGLARQLHGDLARARGLLIGPGEMGDLVIEQLRRAGLRRR